MDNLSETGVVLSECRFILHNFLSDARQNLWLSGDTGTLTVNKMALPIEVSAEMVSYSYFCWKKYDCNWVTKLRSRYYCNMSRIRPRLKRCHWSFDPGESKSQATRRSSDHVGLFHTLSTIDTQRVKTEGASCIGDFGRTDGRKKFELEIPKSWGASYIRGASYI